MPKEIADQILMRANQAPAADIDDRWQQLTHMTCGGELVLISKPSEGKLAICCKGCKDIWFINEETRASWVLAKPVKSGKLWVPGMPKVL